MNKKIVEKEDKKSSPLGIFALTCAIIAFVTIIILFIEPRFYFSRFMGYGLLIPLIGSILGIIESNKKNTRTAKIVMAANIIFFSIILFLRIIAGLDSFSN
jgi:hypothetical protein